VGFRESRGQEVRQTHPDKKITNCAYGAYSLPPLSIEQLEPNVQVCIVGGRRPTSNRPAEQAAVRQLRESWLAKTGNPLIIFENYPFTDRGWYLPAFTAHSLGDTVNATKSVSEGEDIWLSVAKKFDTKGIGFNHFLVYFTARMYWGGSHADVDAIFREYCRLFYGPAELEMRAFFEFCEGNWQDIEKDISEGRHLARPVCQAEARADAGSVYARRIALIGDFLKGLRNKSTQLAQKLGLVPKVRLVGEARSPLSSMVNSTMKRGQTARLRHRPLQRVTNGTATSLRHELPVGLGREQSLLRHSLRGTPGRKA